MDRDPFFWHPDLAALITDPDRSTFRRFDPQAFAARNPDLGLDRFLTPPAEREALRRATLDGVTGDLWVFAYGSLMWDPAFHFAELRRAHVATHARRFILKDTFGGRGTAEAPGLQAALDLGAGCDGLVFRIAAEEVEVETDFLWRRELAGPAYTATFVRADTAAGPLRALTFTADASSPAIVRDIPRAEQVRYLATGAGQFGSSFDYLTNIAAHFAALGIEDADITSLVREVTAHRAAGTETRDATQPLGQD